MGPGRLPGRPGGEGRACIPHCIPRPVRPITPARHPTTTPRSRGRAMSLGLPAMPIVARVRPAPPVAVASVRIVRSTHVGR